MRGRQFMNVKGKGGSIGIIPRKRHSLRADGKPKNGTCGSRPRVFPTIRPVRVLYWLRCFPSDNRYRSSCLHAELFASDVFETAKASFSAARLSPTFRFACKCSYTPPWTSGYFPVRSRRWPAGKTGVSECFVRRKTRSQSVSQWPLLVVTHTAGAGPTTTWTMLNWKVSAPKGWPKCSPNSEWVQGLINRSAHPC